MKKVVPILFIFLYALFCFSCQIGLGEEVDLEAPILNLKTMISGETEIDSSHFGGGLYCRKNVIFKGVATDNKAVEKVYAEIKWSDQEDFSYYADAILEGDNFTFNFNLEKQGVAYIKFVVTDKNKNFGIKSSKVVTLLVDEDAPVASAWYIDRKLNGIQYSLKSLEDLKAIDFELQENKDAAQNVAFSIHSSFKDVMGIKPGSISIQIKDENQKTICVVPNSISNDYAPKFEITEEMLVAADSSLKSGIHYLQVWYNAEDVVSIPESNKAQDVQVEGGWFIWWPESDNPRCVQKPAVDKTSNSILLNVNEAMTLTIFDDDAIENAYSALVTESEYAQIKDLYQQNPEKMIDIVPEEEKSARTAVSLPSTTKRDEVFSFVAPNSPQIMYLVYYIQDSGGKITTNGYSVNVTDASSPILFIASPSNNEIPSKITMKENNSKAFITVTGKTIDTSGCTYLEFVWVPNKVEVDNNKKSEIARNFLNSLTTDSQHKQYAPTGSDKVKVTKLDNKLKIWSVKLNAAEESNGYKTQKFDFEIDLLNDFIAGDYNEKKDNKFFVVKVTRKDGKSSLQEYKLSADTIKPKITSFSPMNTIQVVKSADNFQLEFCAEKDNGLAINTASYSIIQKIENESSQVIGELNSDGHYVATISSTDLKSYEQSGVRPIYIFSAKDIFDNEISLSNTIIVSSLPQLKSITSSSPNVCKMGEVIKFNVNFTDTINNIDNSFTTNPPKLILGGFSDGKDRIATYVSGAGSPSLVFEYTTVKDDVSDKIIIKQKDDFYIDTNNNQSLIEGQNVHLSTITAEDVLKNKVIKVKASQPYVTAYSIKGEGVSKNTDGNYYLNEGKTVVAEVTLSEPIFVQGSPTFCFKNDFVLDFASSNENVITFKGSVPKEKDGKLVYIPKNCMGNSSQITDTFGNVLFVSTDSSEKETNVVLDTNPPAIPTVTKIDGTILSDLISNNSVKFKIKNNDSEPVVKYEYSTNGGLNWIVAKNDGTDEVSDYALLTARVTDKAGNVSGYPKPIVLDIKNSFPSFTVECTSPDGNYLPGKTIYFKVSFVENVKLLKSSATITIANGKQATLTTSPNANSSISSVDFSYTVKENDDFTIKIPKDGITFGDSIQDLYGVTQGTKGLTEEYIRSKVVCDGVAPTVSSAIPDGRKNSSDVYTNGNKITVTFSEKVQKGSGNLILRQTSGWAIPPVLTAAEFNTICDKLSETEKNILALRDENGMLMEDVEDDKLFVAYRNNKYHGTGQYIGPYKKSMQGIDSKGTPDVSAKYVLDFDLDIWDSNSSKKFGYTFNKYQVDTTFVGKTEEKVNEILKEDKVWSAYPTDEDLVTPKNLTNDQNATEISVGNIREVLEKAGVHQRVLDVTSANVSVSGKTVTITFPAGLIDKTDALPDGREWELIFEKGTFLDITGNNFGSAEENKILINGKEFFYSDKVATPVIRVDRYSYGLGIKQCNSEGTLSTHISNDTTEPTGWVRFRIDCETKDAVVKYKANKAIKDESSSSTNKQIAGDTELTNSLITSTSVSIPTINQINQEAPITKKIFVAGSGNYNQSCKEFIGAIGSKEDFSDSEIGTEGVFQTVVKFVNPTTENSSEANQGDDKTDWSIRGTTSKGNEPYISPYPLRDSPNGSPYMRITYRNGVNYYWVSYEILVDSSFSGHGWAPGWRNWYNWAKNWGLMEPGELTKCENMKNWE